MLPTDAHVREDPRAARGADGRTGDHGAAARLARRIDDSAARVENLGDHVAGAKPAGVTRIGRQGRGAGADARCERVGLRA